MPKVQVTLPKNDRFSGEVVTVDIEDIDLGDHLVRTADVRKNYVEKSFMQEKIDERLAGQAVNLKGSLLDDATFAKQILSKYGVSLDAEGKVVFDKQFEEEAIEKVLKGRLESAKGEWDKSALAPVSERASAAEQKLTALQRQLLHLETLEAARKAGVKRELFEVLPGARREAIPVIAQTEHMFDVDPNGHWAVRGAEQGTFVPSKNPSPDRPNASPDEYFASLKEVEAAKTWFEEPRMSGPNVNGTSNARDNGNGQSTSQTDRLKQLRGMQTGQSV